MFGMGNGMSGWEGYQLGRRSVKREQTIKQFAADLHARWSPPPIDVHAVMAHNHALTVHSRELQTQNEELYHINAKLVNDYNSLHGKYLRLLHWAEGATARLRKLGVIKDDAQPR